jgi:hypothetical protein
VLRRRLQGHAGRFVGAQRLQLFSEVQAISFGYQFSVLVAHGLSVLRLVLLPVPFNVGSGECLVAAL